MFLPIILTILFGFYPAPILDATAASVTALVTNYQAAIEAANSTAMLAH